MHEYSIVDLLIDAASEHARKTRASRVTRLHISIGELAGVDGSLLRKAYETFRERTICEHADLVIAEVPASWRCSACGVALARGSRLACPHCGNAGTLASGGELTLERVELEVPDV